MGAVRVIAIGAISYFKLHPSTLRKPKGPFKYYVIKELGGWVRTKDYVIT